MSLKKWCKNNYNKVIFISLCIFSSIVYMQFIMGHYATDTYNIAYVGYDTCMKNWYLTDGRIFSAMFLLIMKICNLPVHSANTISLLFAIVITNISVMKIFNWTDKYVQTKNIKESKVIVKSVNKAFQKSLKKEYLTSENKTITIDDKKTKTTKISMELNDEKLAKISKDFLTYLKDDQEFIKATNSISETKNTKEEIEGLIDEISFDNQSGTTMTVSIYCKGILKEVVRYEVELKQDEETYNIAVTKHKDKYDFKIKQEDVIISKGAITKEKEKISIEASLIGLGNATINITNKEEKNPTINKKEIKDSVKYEDLTEKQMQDITTKLLQNKGFEKLSTIFGSLMPQSY